MSLAAGPTIASLNKTVHAGPFPATVLPSAPSKAPSLKTPELPPAPQPPPPPRQPRFFLDIFAGVHAPVSRAAAAQGLDRFQPMDIMSHSSHDILLDPVFEALLKLCWSGCIGLLMGAPPCKEYSRLKMKPGGPPALRTPEYMDGVPNLTPTQLQKVRDSKEIHRKVRALLYAVVLEQPPGSLAWLEPENHSLFQTFQGHLPWADACKYGKNWPKACFFASNSPRIGRLAALCNHNIQHESIAGVKNSKGEYLSTLTAEYPPLLAQQIIQAVSHRVSRISGECRPLPLQGTSSFKAPLGTRLKMCDGAGNFSSADHSLPHPVEPHHSIAKAWLQWAAKSGLDKRIFAHVAQAKNEPPLTSAEVFEAIGLLFETIRQPLPSNLEPERQQPYRLQILRILGAVTDDPDMALLHFMEHGVPTAPTPPYRPAINGHQPRSNPRWKPSRRSTCATAIGKPPQRGGSLDTERDRQRLGDRSQYVGGRSPEKLALRQAQYRFCRRQGTALGP